MKKSFILTAIFVSSFALAQTPTKNYVKSTSYQVPVQNEAEINNLPNTIKIENITYYDGLGRPEQSIAMRQGGDVTPLNTQNELNFDWESGNITTPFFNRIGLNSENEIINGITPFGDTNLIWECRNQDGDATGQPSRSDGGWNTDFFAVDKTIGYRYSIWVKRTHSATDGRVYHGTKYVSDLNGVAQSNPYFFSSYLPQVDTWYLMVGIIHPYDYTGWDTGESGVYDMQGNKVLDGKEFKWNPTTTGSYFRNYLYYTTDTNITQQFYKPLLQRLDGNELTLSQITNNAVYSDIVTPVTYDAYGRQPKEYLPYAEVTLGEFTPNDMIISDAEHYYVNTYPDDLDPNTPNPYSKKAFEASPLNRVLEQGAPGEDWKVDPTSDSDHTIKFDYQTNTAADEIPYYKVIFSTASTETPQLYYDGFYAANELYKSITKDENWTVGLDHTTEEFKNKQGQVLLKRTYNNTISHDTQYVYDDYGNLTYVLSPKGSDTVLNAANEVDNSILDNLCYQYHYDYRNRLVEKKIPGKGWEHIVYDKLDRPVLTQDANQRLNNKWLFTKYDAFSRVVYTGEHTNNVTRLALQTTINGQSVFNESRPANIETIGDMSLYHSNKVLPTSNIEVFTVNYYDDYPQDIDTVFPNIVVFALAGQNIETSFNTKSLATGSKTRVLGTNNWIINATYYDEKARPVYVGSQNKYLNTVDTVKSALDFVGKVIETESTHVKNGVTIKTNDVFTYDHANRLLTQTQIIDNGAPELIVNNGYDALGQLVNKKVGGVVAAIPETSSGLQSIDYKYNIRGWLKQINDVDNIANDLFGFKLNYNTTEGLVGSWSPELYNGNISQSIWRTANIDTDKRSYGYAYDDLNRITRGTMRKGNNLDVYTGHHLRPVAYDKNGNILSLKRDNAVTIIDDLTYVYNGNQLQSVTEAAPGDVSTEGFVDGNTIGEDYTYDVNGNMKKDLNKDITEIIYNHLNLPKKVTFNDNPNKNIEYIYDATGVKQAKVVTDGSSLTTTRYAGNFIYEETAAGEVLKFFSHPEGYIQLTEKGYFEYVYQFKDHLGNIRLSYSDSDGNGDIDAEKEIIEENNYYPFGLKHRGYNNVVNGTHHPYGYVGKEENEELGLNWHDFGARNYDAALGRWMNLDPLAEQMRRHSPYNYAFNNPIYFMDPDGMAPVGTDPKKKKLKKVTPGSVTKNSMPGVYAATALTYRVGGKGPQGRVAAGAVLLGGASIVALGEKTSQIYNFFADVVNETNIFDSASDSSGSETSTAESDTESSTDAELELPGLDSTGKVHGELPEVADLGKFEDEELEILKEDLGKSVQARIKATNEKGPSATDMQNKQHGERQAQEQDLIKSLEKYLKGNKK